MAGSRRRDHPSSPYSPHRASQSFTEPGVEAAAHHLEREQDCALAAIIFEQFHDHRQEQVGSLLGLELPREVLLHARFFHAAEGWVGQDHIHLIDFVEHRFIDFHKIETP